MSQAFFQAVETARAHNPVIKRVVKPEYWRGTTIVESAHGTFHVYGADAWEKPSEAPMLSWSPPTGTPVADVDMAGSVTFREQDTYPVRIGTDLIWACCVSIIGPACRHR